MNHTILTRCGFAGLIAAALLLPSATVKSDPVFFAGTPPAIAQVPLYIKDAVPPLNMLVMGKDHKIYYEAYNDASDLNGDGALDIGYKPATIDYYGYYNSSVCYTYETINGGRFVPSSAASNKQCSGKWSGDFLNYLTTSRMDALRRVLYGGWRQVDTATDTTLQGAFFPQDAHSWGKEYKSIARDGYDISKYAPLSEPTNGKYHLFAVTTVTGNDATFASGYTAPLFRVLKNSDFRVWNWLSIEGPVAGNKCFTSGNVRTDCVGSSSSPFPGHPGSRAAFNTMETTYAIAANRFGSDTIDRIDCNGNCNPHGDDDNYLTIIQGEINIRSNRGGTYQFRVDGDDVIDFTLTRQDGTQLVAPACYDSNGRGFGACGGAETSAAVTLAGNTTYKFKFRHEEGSGGDGYKLEWRKTSGSNQMDWRVITTNAGGDADGNGDLTDGTTRTTYDLTPVITSGTRDDYNVRVQVCPGGSLTALRDSTCKTYPGGNAKPTGILHDYGENQKMYFGLITGSQFNNLEGGVLRKNISNFADEINANDGTFKAGIGIANALSKLRMIGGGYNSGTNNLNSDSNWNWANGTGNCPSVGGRAIVNGECRMWGNPIAEMMFEGMRYFAGAGAATTRFGSGGATQGHTEETTMGLSQDTWKDPYAETGGFPTCARPFETVISDINPSYDGDLPGSAFATIASDSAVPGFDASGQGQTIWSNEPGLGGTRNVFIGEVQGTPSDGAPTAKSASSFGNIRGLSPEEPTKGGTYYAASVAHYGYVTDLNAAADLQKLGIYSIALASPLPKIEFPVGGSTITILPFAKTASGTFGTDPRKPTNTIVDFYVEQIVNLPNQPTDLTVNGGRASAIFRINYEDVEQGNDHDMDAIVKYTIQANTDGTVTVKLDSEYAAGSADQNIGYVLSGTTQDGIYLEVRDTDSGPGSFLRYDFNTPPGINPGGCTGVTTGVCNQQLPTTATRTFTPSATAPTATQLQNPLWYAAKYGGFKDADGDDLPDAGEWDSNKTGQPDNYFLVTNPLQLRTQLTKAFDNIANRDLDVGVATISGARVGNSSFTLQPTFNRGRNGNDWTGNLSAVAVNQNGTLGDALWSAQAKLPGPGSRNIRTIQSGAGVAFDSANITSLASLGIDPSTVSTVYGASYTAGDLVDYLRGDQTREISKGGTGNTLRERSSVLGDIVNSEPVIVSPRSNYGYGYYTGTMFSGYTGTGGYLEAKATRKTVAYVGANDGMLHAFDASTEPCTDTSKTCAKAGAGKELFGFIPGGVLGRLGRLALPDNAYPGSTESFDHQYYVDGQISVGDAKDGSTWKTILVGSTGAGGRSVFALDVSDPDSFADNDVLWELNSSIDHDIGNVYGKPMLVPLENNEWGILFGNGYGGNSSDPTLYILDAFDGSVIRKITADDGNLGSAGPIADASQFICSVISNTVPPFLQPRCARKVDPYNGLGQITAIDKNGNGKVDTVYGGDLQGNLWKFDLSNTSDSSWAVANSGTALFTADTGSERQPITGAIRVAAGPGTGVMVYFGTGRYFVTGDNDVPASPQVQSLYAVFDNFTSAAGGRANLAVQTITEEKEVVDDRGTPTDAKDDITYISRNISNTPVSYYGTGAKRGWYLDLKVAAAAGTGERFIATPLIQSGRVFFTTYEPSENSCDPGGINFQYGLDLLSGGGTLANVQVLPSGTPACTDGKCGGVQIGAKGAAAQPPVMGTGVAAINPLKKIDETCVPGPGKSCASFEQCQVVIYPGGFVLPRPCGRQSWRQLK